MTHTTTAATEGHLPYTNLPGVQHNPPHVKPPLWPVRTYGLRPKPGARNANADHTRAPPTDCGASRQASHQQVDPCQGLSGHDRIGSGGGSSTHVENITLSSVVPETWHAVEEAGDSEGLIEDNLEPDDADKVPCIFDEEAQRCVTPKSILLAQIIYLFSIWSSASSLCWESTNCRRRKEGRKEGRKE